MKHDKYEILLVDDNPLNVELLVEILNMQGYNVTVANNGAKALEKAREINPDLMILDIAMPDIDGFEVLETLKMDSATSQIPVMYITALNDNEDMIRGLSLGAVDYITKPFNIQETLSRIKRHLS